jgi:uncharacterized membrane protein YphA (DoxX/SURF4 family)
MNIFDPATFQRRRTAALIALSVALLVQLIWFAREVFFDQTALASLTRPVIFTAAFVAVSVTRGQYRAVNTIGRLVIAGAFLLALWNRFDDFNRFIRYTGIVNSFMPRATIPLLAILATVAEITCCLTMFVGLKVRFAAAASGLLLFLFATAMTISGLEQFTWAVYVLATGGWMLSTVDASMLSLDGLFFTNRKETSWKSPVATR